MSNKLMSASPMDSATNHIHWDYNEKTRSPRALALMPLNRRIPNGTYGGVRVAPCKAQGAQAS